MKIAIVADWIYGGGSEKVVEELHKLYPDAPIYTSFCSDEWRDRLNSKVITGYLQNPPFKQLRKFLPPLRQRWFSKLDLSNFDIVISCTGNGEAKFINVPNGKHICYCYTPVHFYWRHFEKYLQNPGFKPAWLVRLGLRLLINPLRKQDYKAAQKVDEFIAISSHIQADIKSYYHKESEIINPPVDINRFKKINTKNITKKGYVTLGRQVPMKRIDLIIQACNDLKLNLTIIGRGPEHNHLVSNAGDTIHFKTNVLDKDIPEELAKNEAFIFASFEDFGIAPIEAMASGLPIIAYKAGGALDYVQPKITGEFFNEQTSSSLKEILKDFEYKKYKTDLIKETADNFSSDKFGKKIKVIINKH